jgi:hypothetical protein
MREVYEQRKVSSDASALLRSFLLAVEGRYKKPLVRGAFNTSPRKWRFVAVKPSPHLRIGISVLESIGIGGKVPVQVGDRSSKTLD